MSLDQLLQVLHALDARLLLADTQAYAGDPPTTALVARGPSTQW